MIRTIIFDIGNVLTAFGWRDFMGSFGFDKETEAKVCRATVESPFWCECDRGVLSDEEILDGFIQNDPTVEKELRQIYSNLHGIVTRLDYAIPWIQELKEKGYQVLVLSNFSEKGWHENQDALDFMEYVDGGIISYTKQLIKPDPAIYRLLLDQYGLKAEECVFLDDTAVNVKGAESVGMNGIVFENREQAIAELKKLGVE